MRHIGIIFFLIIGSVLASPKPSKHSKKKKTVFTKVVKSSEIFDLLAYPTKVQAKRSSHLLAETEGVVENIRVNLGSKVKKGAPLLTIRNTDPVYDYKPLKLRSPIDGVVAQIHENEGSMVKKNSALLTITDPTEYKMILEVTATDLQLLKTGMKGEFSVFKSSLRWPVTVSGVSPFINPTSGTAQVELSVNHADKASLPPIGTLGQVLFKVNLHKGISLPEHAVKYFGKKTFVYSLEKNKVKKREVGLGSKRKGEVEILTGLDENSIIVEQSSQFLEDGEEVVVSKPKES